MGSLEWRLLPLGAILCLLLGRSAGGPSSLHTLHYFTTAVWEPGWRILRLTSLMYVDDQLLGRYDTATDQCVPQSSWVEEISRNDADFWARNTGWNFGSSVVPDLMILKNLDNQSRGIHTLQVFFGCEMSGDDSTRGLVKYGYNGRDFLRLDLPSLRWISLNAEAEPVKRKWEAEQGRGKSWGRFLKEDCVEGLHTYLHYGKEALLRIDPPKGRVARKVGLEGLESLVCQLHGFYPKEIDVTWRKGGEVWHQDTCHRGVLPNSDGTYYTWLSISVDPQERDHYWCHVEHDGLPEPLDLAWEESASVSKVVVALEIVATVFLLCVEVTYCLTSVSKVVVALEIVATVFLLCSRVTYCLKEQLRGILTITKKLILWQTTNPRCTIYQGSLKRQMIQSESTQLTRWSIQQTTP